MDTTNQQLVHTISAHISDLECLPCLDLFSSPWGLWPPVHPLFTSLEYFCLLFLLVTVAASLVLARGTSPSVPKAPPSLVTSCISG